MENVIRTAREDGYASVKVRQFSESAIREMSRIAAAHNAINLAQGFPDFRLLKLLNKLLARLWSKIITNMR